MTDKPKIEPKEPEKDQILVRADHSPYRFCTDCGADLDGPAPDVCLYPLRHAR